MTIALGLVLLGVLLIYGGVTGTSVKSLLLGDNKTPATPPKTYRTPDGNAGTVTTPDGTTVTGTVTSSTGAKTKGMKIHELFYDPLKIAFDEGRWIAPIGGHSDHVHVSFLDIPSALQIIAYAQQNGLRVGENPYVGDVPEKGIHVKDSYHYRNFPGKINGKTLGMAVDVSGSSAKMGMFAKWVAENFTNETFTKR